MTEDNYTTTQPIDGNLTILGILYTLNVGQSRSWPIEKVASIRSLASQAGLQFDRKYKTNTNRSMRQIIVTRLS